MRILLLLLLLVSCTYYKDRVTVGNRTFEVFQCFMYDSIISYQVGPRDSRIDESCNNQVCKCERDVIKKES